MTIRAVLDELKKRSVVRVAGVYAVAGWAVFQVVNALFPALNLPPWTVSLAALLFLAGFPIAVALAWMFEITPDIARDPRFRDLVSRLQADLARMRNNVLKWRREPRPKAD